MWPVAGGNFLKGGRPIMRKAQVNFIIDALMMLAMAAIIGLGLLMKYVLVPGREADDLYGAGAGLTWLGMDRHQWGLVHFWIGAGLAGLLALHIILHWGQIVCLYQALVRRRGVRTALALVFAGVCAALIGLALWARPQVGRRRQEGQGLRRGRGGDEARVVDPEGTQEPGAPRGRGRQR